MPGGLDRGETTTAATAEGAGDATDGSQDWPGAADAKGSKRHGHAGRGPRGRLLWEYRPPRVHPILYAGLLVFGAVFAMGSLENALRSRQATLYLAYFAPVGAVVLLMVALWRNPVRIHEHGIAPSRIALLRWRRPFIAWDDVACAYPASYDVTGAFVSPFASSDGKVTQTGIGLELRDGHTETVRFTPTRFSQTARRSRGYREAMDVVRDLFAARGRSLVPDAEAIDPATREALLRQAREPFLPFFAIVFLFASAAPVLWLLAAPLQVPIAWALPIALLAPLGTSLQSWRRSRRRNRILDRISKVAEHERGRAASDAASANDAAAGIPANAAVPAGPLVRAAEAAPALQETIA